MGFMELMRGINKLCQTVGALWMQYELYWITQMVHRQLFPV